MGRKRKIESTSAFTTLVGQVLTKVGVSQSNLAREAGTNLAYTNQVITGRKPPTPEWTKLVLSVLDVPPADREQIYEAAKEEYFRRSGFDLDLSKKD